MKGICFKEPLFNKVVDGIKTQTRRIIFPNTDYTFWSQLSFEGMEEDPDAVMKLDKDGEIIAYKDGEPKLFKYKGTYGLFEGDQFYFDSGYARPRYQPGEIVYLKEPYIITKFRDKPIIYKFEYEEEVRKLSEKQGYGISWKNKLFMPEKHARYFIQITDVTAQRLQDITEKDAKVH
jgi:hypothetical protein